jgi:hypothetical protein
MDPIDIFNKAETKPKYWHQKVRKRDTQKLYARFFYHRMIEGSFRCYFIGRTIKSILAQYTLYSTFLFNSSLKTS